MKRSRIVLLSLVLLLAVLALPAFARADSVSVGWTWDDSAVSIDPPQSGWTWDEAVAPPADGQSLTSFPTARLEAGRGASTPIYAPDMESGLLDSGGRFEEYAQDGLESLPADLRAQMSNVAIVVEDEPSRTEF